MNSIILCTAILGQFGPQVGPFGPGLADMPDEQRIQLAQQIRQQEAFARRQARKARLAKRSHYWAAGASAARIQAQARAFALGRQFARPRYYDRYGRNSQPTGSSGYFPVISLAR